MADGNRIEPWREPPASYFPISRPSRGETKGTVVHYEGETLRSRGRYSTDDAEALLASRSHCAAEGVGYV